MSVTMHLFVPNTEIKWIPGKIDLMTIKEIKEKAAEDTKIYSTICDEADKKFGDASSKEKEEYIENEYSTRGLLCDGHWDDNKEHDTIEIYSYNKRRYKSKNKRYYKYMKRIKEIFGDKLRQDRGKYITTKYLPVDCVAYRQGWFFTKKFFKSSVTTYYAFTKDEVIKILDKLIDKSYSYDKSCSREELEQLTEKERSYIKYITSGRDLEYYKFYPGREAYDYFISEIDKLNDNTFIFEVAF